MNHKTTIAPLAVSLLLVTQSSSFACSCSPSPGPLESLAFADTVFVGTVIGIEAASYPDGDFEIPYRRVTLRVSQTWKGPVTFTKVVNTGLGSGDCGVYFGEGSSCLVYAYGSIEYWTSICSRTRHLSFAAEDLQALGVGATPQQPLLFAAQSGTAATLRWETNWLNIRLETTTSLNAPVVWQPATNHVATAGQYYITTNSPTGPRLFYRLAGD